MNWDSIFELKNVRLYLNKLIHTYIEEFEICMKNLGLTQSALFHVTGYIKSRCQIALKLNAFERYKTDKHTYLLVDSSDVNTPTVIFHVSGHVSLVSNYKERSHHVFFCGCHDCLQSCRNVDSQNWPQNHLWPQPIHDVVIPDSGRSHYIYEQCLQTVWRNMIDDQENPGNLNRVRWYHRKSHSNNKNVNAAVARIYIGAVHCVTYTPGRRARFYLSSNKTHETFMGY